MPFYTYPSSRSPADIGAVQALTGALLSAVSDQSLADAREIMHNETMQRDRDLVRRTLTGLLDARAECDEAFKAKEIGGYILAMEGFRRGREGRKGGASGREGEDGEEKGEDGGANGEEGGAGATSAGDKDSAGGMSKSEKA